MLAGVQIILNEIKVCIRFWQTTHGSEKDPDQKKLAGVLPSDIGPDRERGVITQLCCLQLSNFIMQAGK